MSPSETEMSETPSQLEETKSEISLNEEGVRLIGQQPETASEVATTVAGSTVAVSETDLFPMVKQFMVTRVDMTNVQIESLSAEERSDLKIKLQEECLNICNSYCDVLAVEDRWTTYEGIKMANDDDDDDLFDVDNAKLKAKLKVISAMIIGASLAYYFNATWIWFVFQIGSMAPYMYDSFTGKDNYDSVIFPNKDSYFGQSLVSIGFKTIGKRRGRANESNHSLHPKAVELYNYFKYTQAKVRALEAIDKKQKK